jgi:hypothetical protein
VDVHPHKKSLQVIWKSFKRMFRKNRMVQRTTALSVLLLLATFLLPVLRILPMAEQTPFIALHYNIYLGVDRFGPIQHLFFIPFTGLLFLLVNIFVQARSWKSQKTLSLFFAAASPLLQFILLVAMILIVLINV